jgi:hypothetical protein
MRELSTILSLIRACRIAWRSVLFALLSILVVSSTVLHSQSVPSTSSSPAAPLTRRVEPPSSRVPDGGIIGQVSSPEDRAHFAYVLAKLYARNGLPDRSLEYLRRAMEEGYKGINQVYKDVEFAALRKDPRFAQLMEVRPASIPE